MFGWCVYRMPTIRLKMITHTHSSMTWGFFFKLHRTSVTQAFSAAINVCNSAAPVYLRKHLPEVTSVHNKYTGIHVPLARTNLAHRNRSDFCDLRLRCPSRTPEIVRFPRQEKAMLHCDLRVRWKVASDLRFRAAISESKTPSFCGISGDLAPSTRKSQASAIVRFWCAKMHKLYTIQNSCSCNSCVIISGLVVTWELWKQSLTKWNENVT